MRYMKILNLSIVALGLSVGSICGQNNDAANATKEGIEASKAKDWDKAVAAFRKATQLEPRYAPNLVSALQQRGTVYISQKKFPEAIADFSDALKLKANDSDIIERRAYAEMQMKDYDKALADYTEAIRLKPDEPKYYQVRAYILQTKNDFKGALADVNKVLQLDPDNADAQARKKFLEAKLNGPATPPPMPTGPIRNPSIPPVTEGGTPSNEIQPMPTVGKTQARGPGA